MIFYRFYFDKISGRSPLKSRIKNFNNSLEWKSYSLIWFRYQIASTSIIPLILVRKPLQKTPIVVTVVINDKDFRNCGDRCRTPCRKHGSSSVALKFISLSCKFNRFCYCRKFSYFFYMLLIEIKASIVTAPA